VIVKREALSLAAPLYLCNLIESYQIGTFNDGVRAADLIQQHEAQIANCDYCGMRSRGHVEASQPDCAGGSKDWFSRCVSSRLVRCGLERLAGPSQRHQAGCDYPAVDVEYMTCHPTAFITREVDNGVGDLVSGAETSGRQKV